MKPILFNTAMVQAILDGRKTMTRRVVKPRYRNDEYGFQVITTMDGHFVRVEKIDENECGIFEDGTERHVSPPYQPGDILWVREKWEHDDYEGFVDYRADFTDEEAKDIKWRPSIHMPKDAARIYLRVTDVRVERVQDISEDDTKAEGIEPRFNVRDQFSGVIARQRFSELWDSINAKRGHGWDENPFVWVISFERCDKPESEKTL